MILDRRTTFFDALPILPSTTFGDVVDSSVARDLGNGQPLYWYTIATDVPASGTIVMQLITSDYPDMSSPRVMLEMPARDMADLADNPLVGMVTLPLEGLPYKRYVSANIVVTGSPGDLKVTSGLTLDAHGWRAYPEGEN